MRTIGLILTMLTLAAVPVLVACVDAEATPPETTTFGVGPTETAPRIVVVPPRPAVVVVTPPVIVVEAPVRPRPVVVVEAPAPPPPLTVRIPLPPSITITPPVPPSVRVE